MRFLFLVRVLRSFVKKKSADDSPGGHGRSREGRGRLGTRWRGQPAQSTRFLASGGRSRALPAQFGAQQPDHQLQRPILDDQLASGMPIEINRPSPERVIRNWRPRAWHRCPSAVLEFLARIWSDLLARRNRITLQGHFFDGGGRFASPSGSEFVEMFNFSKHH